MSSNNLRNGDEIQWSFAKRKKCVYIILVYLLLPIVFSFLIQTSFHRHFERNYENILFHECYWLSLPTISVLFNDQVLRLYSYLLKTLDAFPFTLLMPHIVLFFCFLLFYFQIWFAIILFLVNIFQFLFLFIFLLILFCSSCFWKQFPSQKKTKKSIIIHVILVILDGNLH